MKSENPQSDFELAAALRSKVRKTVLSLFLAMSSFNSLELTEDVLRDVAAGVAKNMPAVERNTGFLMGSLAPIEQPHTNHYVLEYNDPITNLPIQLVAPFQLISGYGLHTTNTQPYNSEYISAIEDLIDPESGLVRMTFYLYNEDTVQVVWKKDFSSPNVSADGLGQYRLRPVAVTA
jgi:hypothetical protein